MTQEALKLALEALEVATTPLAKDRQEVLRAITAIKEALAQEQEPVAWIHNFIEGGISIGKRPADLNRHPDRWTALYKDPKPCSTCEALARTVMLDQTSHDTIPPQRTWVGLTDEEIDKLRSGYQSGRIGSFVALAKAIEAKFKELNT